MKPLFRTPVGKLGPVPGSEFHNDRHDHLHGGIDLNAPMGTPVVAPRRGVITFAGLSLGLGGNKLVIDHGVLEDGNQHETRHYHFGPKHSYWQDVIMVNVGQIVKAGQTLGWCGVSGNAAAPHDHYEHHVNGREHDPLQYLRDYQVVRKFFTRQRYALAYPHSEGPDIPLLQQRLTAHGFTVRADGIYGTHTLCAVRAFQASHRLTVDGIIGKETWQALLRRPAL